MVDDHARRQHWRDNVFVERFWRTIKYEEVYLHAYDSVAEARQSPLCVAVTNNSGQNRLDKPGCHWLAVGEEHRLQQNGLDVQETIALVCAVHGSGRKGLGVGVPCRNNQIPADTAKLIAK
jgi:hypothetical protein